LNYLPDETAWGHYRTHFLTSYFSSHQTKRHGDESVEMKKKKKKDDDDEDDDDEDDDDVDFLSIVDNLLDSLRQQILSSDDPVVLNRESYTVHYFTDGFFQAWSLQEQSYRYQSDESFQYVAIHGVPKK
jgi:hypothetical protein